MDKKSIIIYKPRLMKFSIEHKDGILYYEWRKNKFKIDYLSQQQKLLNLLDKFNINVNHYLKSVSLSRSKYYETMKTKNDNPVTNLKIHLIYLYIKKDYVYIFNQYVLLRHIINTSICSTNNYASISNLSFQTVSKIRTKSFNKYRYGTFKKIESANRQIQKNLLSDIQKENKPLFLILSNLSMVEFYKKYYDIQQEN